MGGGGEGFLCRVSGAIRATCVVIVVIATFCLLLLVLLIIETNRSTGVQPGTKYYAAATAVLLRSVPSTIVVSVTINKINSTS